MLQGSYGLLIALLLTALLGYQAARAARGSRLRQTYNLAAGGFGLILVLNLLYTLGIASGLLANVFSFAAVAMLIGAVASFAVALFNGEFQAKLRQAQQYTAEERERIAQRRAEREQAAAEPPDPATGGQDKTGR